MALSYQQQYYQDNKDRIKASAKEWAKNNPDKVRRAHKKFEDNIDREEYNKDMREYRKSNPIKTMLKGAKQRAKKSGLEFTLLEEDIVIPEICPLLGIRINCNSDNKYIRPSLDRKDSSKGYTKENTHVTSWRANMLKNNATSDELLMIGFNLATLQGDV